MPNRLQAPSPWLVGLLPWVIDLLFKTSFLNTLWGALLWGFLLVIYFAQARLVDPNLKRYLNILLWAAGALWLSGWIKSFSHPVENPLKPSDSLYFLHATFLVAAGGMLLIVLLASSLGALKERNIYTPDQKQRTLNAQSHSKRNTLSLEGLLKLCTWSFSLVRIFWLLGCTLALLALTVHTVQTHSSGHLNAWKESLEKWAHDPSIWAVWLLGLIFIYSDEIWNKFKTQSLFRGYLYTALLALLVVLSVVWSESSQMGHINREFLR